MITEIRFLYSEGSAPKIEVYGKPEGGTAASIVSEIRSHVGFAKLAKNKIVEILNATVKAEQAKNTWMVRVLADELISSEESCMDKIFFNH